MCWWFWSYDSIKEPKWRTCSKCKIPFRLLVGGNSRFHECRYHKIVGEHCCHCGRHSSRKTATCYHVAEKTWKERLTGKL